MERRKILETEWSSKNEKSFSKYTNGSHFKAVWKHYCGCGEKHEWEASVKDRILKCYNCSRCSGAGHNTNICPCKSLEKLRPDLAKEWHPKNKDLPINFPCYSDKKVWWKCLKKIATALTNGKPK